MDFSATVTRGVDVWMPVAAPHNRARATATEAVSVNPSPVSGALAVEPSTTDCRSTRPRSGRTT